MCKLYRVDKRVFKVGEEIIPQTEFEYQLHGEKKLVEDLLNQTRPEGMPERKDCLFLFFELAGALKFLQKYGGNIYQVRPIGCFHKGDVNKIDNLLDLARYTVDRVLLTAAANEYWKAGTHTFMPCYEILAPGCVVEKCLSTTEEYNLFCKEMRIYGSIEKTQLYVKLLTNR